MVLGLFIVGVLIVYSWEHAMRAYRSGDSLDRRPAAALALEDDRVDLADAAVPAAARSACGAICACLPIRRPRRIAVPEIIDVEEQALRDAEAAGIELDAAARRDGREAG